MKDLSSNSSIAWLQAEGTLPDFGTTFVGLGPLAQSLVTAALRSKSTHPLLIVCTEKAQARSLLDDLKFFVGKEKAESIHYLPPIEFDYYKGVLPNAETMAERNAALFYASHDPENRLFVTTVGALMQKLMPRKVFDKAFFQVAVNDEVDRDLFVERLLGLGYQRQPVAYDPGTFSIRGGLMDLYSPLYRSPIRIEFYGDLVETMKFYDPESQRSLSQVESAYCLPLFQYPLLPESPLDEVLLRVKKRLDALDVPKLQRDEVINDLEEKNLVAPFLFPTICEGSACFIDYFPDDLIFIWDGVERIKERAGEVELPRLTKNAELFAKEPTPIATAEELFLNLDELGELCSRERKYVFERFEAVGVDSSTQLPSNRISLEAERSALKNQQSSKTVFEGFVARFRDWIRDGIAVNVVCHTHTHEDRLRLLLEPYGITTQTHPVETAAYPNGLALDPQVLHLWQGAISESVLFAPLHLVFLSEEEIFGKKKRSSTTSKWDKSKKTKATLDSFRQLSEGDYVVHKDQGIGRYLGLKSMSFLGVPNDYVVIEYRDGDKLYVPSYRVNTVQKYSGGERGAVVLDKMGGERWEKAKKKAEKAAQELAGQLLDLQAKRKLIPAHAFKSPEQSFRQFEMSFPFDETPDQMKAIEDTLASLAKPYPMDRLIVGDVGYGKTEVAMRAAYLCVEEGKQVCVVVPTTVLAFQHFESFRERFKDTAIQVEMVSRMRKPSEIKKTLERAKEGKVDVLIGTHRLFSSDVNFKDLALVVVDEEHRFGVVHKEKLKKLARSVHVLSMTATPIPRTLNMAMAGIKDISLITTPPPDRMAVRTFICRRSDEVITEAITNELVREGQVFFLHNRVETIDNVARDLREILPKARIEVAHGQMDGKTLEGKMLGFYHGDFDILVCTSIIESGIDISRANTIIIDRADRLGLAQLYQLRGRVGRSAKRAYCYLLVPPEQSMTKDAKQRLQVMQRYSTLGAGFNIASYDLEIRGAGDLLGKEQSGHIHAVGIDMYFELLEESVRVLNGEDRKIEVEPEINLKIAAYFPSEYLPDVSERVSIYRQLSSVDDEEGVSMIEEEIHDRFGKLPEEVINLLGLMRIKLYLKRMHVTHLNCGPKKASLRFADTTPVEGQKIIELIQKGEGSYSVTPDNKLVFEIEDGSWKAILTQVQRLSDVLL